MKNQALFSLKEKVKKISSAAIFVWRFTGTTDFILVAFSVSFVCLSGCLTIITLSLSLRVSVYTLFLWAIVFSVSFFFFSRFKWRNFSKKLAH